MSFLPPPAALSLCIYTNQAYLGNIVIIYTSRLMEFFIFCKKFFGFVPATISDQHVAELSQNVTIIIVGKMAALIAFIIDNYSEHGLPFYFLF